MAELRKVSATACDNPQREADVVFIHGLGGDAYGTWRYGESDDTSWPHWLADEFHQVGVWSLAHEASPSTRLGLLDRLKFWKPANRDAGQSMALPDSAGQVLDLMRLHGDFQGDRPLIFVCHSLGGLLTKQLLRHASDNADQPELHAVCKRASAVLFLATPHQGASLASLINNFSAIFGPTASLSALRAHDPHLRNLYNWYRNHATQLGIETITYYEGRDIAGFRIVDETSSQPGVGTDAVMLPDDHLSIAKPSRREAQVCLALSRLVRSRLQTQPAPAPLVGLHVAASPASQADNGAGSQTHVHVHVHTQTDMDGKAQVGAGTCKTEAPMSHERPCQLPPAAHTFFGRVDALQTLVDRLRNGLNTTVIADAGMGKTALAAEALRQLLNTPNLAQARVALAGTAFPDGIVFLDLYRHHGQADQAWTEVAHALRGSEFLQTNVASVRAVQACAGKRFLLIVEGGEEARGGTEADGFVRTTRRALLEPLVLEGPVLWLTRRNDQSIPIEELRLDQPLGDADARALFDHLCDGRVATEWSNRALALLGGHPLAITWVAALLGRGDEPPQYLLDDLQQQPGRNLRDPEEAGHTLHWLFDRSLRSLDEHARRSLHAAGLLAPEPFPLATIAAATRLDERAQREALAACVRSSLLRLEPSNGTAVMPHWRFGHALCYVFARSATETEPDARVALLPGLAQRVHADLVACQTTEAAAQAAAQAQLSMQHAIALLRADAAPGLWLLLTRGLLYNISDRFVALGQLTSALSVLRAVEAWLASLATMEADQICWQREIAACHSRLGNLLQVQGDLLGAQRRFEVSLQVAERLVAQDPKNPERQHDLSISHNKIGDLLQAQGDLFGARRCFEASLHIRERLTAQDPTNTQRLRDLSVSHHRFGILLQTQGDLSGAQNWFEADLRIAEQLAGQDPMKAEWQRDLSISYSELGSVLQAQGDLFGAQERFEASLRIVEWLAAQDPANAQWQRDLSVRYNKLGDLLEAQDDLPGAQQRIEASLCIVERLTAQDPANAQWRRDLSISQEKLGALLQAQGDLQGARLWFDLCLSIRERLATQDPANVQWQHDLATAQIKSGLLGVVQGDVTGGMCCLQEARGVFSALVQRAPSHPQFQRDLENVEKMIVTLDSLPTS